jgi:hypothetical protein
MMFNFFKMNLFKAALTPEFRLVVAQQDPDTMMIKRMLDKEVTTQVEEVTRQEPDPTKEEDLVAETTPIAMGSTATSANYKDTGKKNAGRDSRRTNLAEMLRVKCTGPGFTSWVKTQTRNRSTPLNKCKTDSTDSRTDMEMTNSI